MAASRDNVTWLASPLDVGPGAALPVAFVADLNDPLLAAFLTLPASREDIADGARLSLPDQRKAFFSRRALTRHCIAGVTGVPAGDAIVAHDGNGAPRILSPAGALHISVSARGTVAAVLIAQAPAGIDIERRDAGDAVPWNVLHTHERARLKALPKIDRARAFLRVWCVKEAYVKALGRGLKGDAEAVEIYDDGGQDLRIIDAGRLVSGCLIEARELSAGGCVMIAACVVLAA